MLAFTWPGQVHQRLFGSRVATGRRRPVRRSAVRPHLEALEERITPTSFNVTPTGTGLQSLEGAIAQANKDTSEDTIVLAPGKYNLTAPQVITTTHKLLIDGVQYDCR